MGFDSTMSYWRKISNATCQRQYSQPEEKPTTKTILLISTSAMGFPMHDVRPAPKIRSRSACISLVRPSPASSHRSGRGISDFASPHGSYARQVGGCAGDRDAVECVTTFRYSLGIGPSEWREDAEVLLDACLQVWKLPRLGVCDGRRNCLCCFVNLCVQLLEGARVAEDVENRRPCCCCGGVGAC